LIYRKDQRLVKSEPFLMSTQDKLFSASLLVDPACIYFINPSGFNFLDFLYFTQNIRNIDFSDGNYFYLLDFLFTVGALWSFASFLAIFRKYKPMSFDPQLISSVFIRIISFCFILALMATYQCSEGNSENGDPDLNDSVMNVDCYETCWEGRHLAFSVTSIVILGLYLLVSIIYSEPICNLVDGLQFRTHPHYLIMRLPMLSALIAVRFADLSLAQGSALFFSILSIFLSVCWKFGVTNVPSLSLYHNCAYLAVIFLSLSHVIVKVLKLDEWVYFALGGVVGVAVFLTLRICKRKLPLLILHEEKVDTATLFAFAFRFNVLTDDLKRHKNAYEQVESPADELS